MVRAGSRAGRLSVFLMILAGCGRQPPSRVYQVEGKLLVGEAPAANASIAFHPLDGKRSSTCSVATTHPDGSYCLTTYGTADGAPEGEYVVTVIWHNVTVPIDECACPNPTEHDRLLGIFADRTSSSLRATVRPEQNDITIRVPDIDRIFGRKSSAPLP